MGLSAEPPKDPFRTGMAVLNLLGDAAERAPVVVVAEDAHWLDEATTEVLAFVARRIEADAITILVTSRETIPRALRGLPSRTLAPLTSDAAEALLHGLDADLAPATRARILEQAQGNPLGLVELLASSARAEEEPRAADVAAAQHAAGAHVQRARGRPAGGHPRGVARWRRSPIAPTSPRCSPRRACSRRRR